MRIVDAREKPCPQPVIMAKNAADEGAEEITIIVDNEIAKVNVEKFASQLEFNISTVNKDDGIYILLKKQASDRNELSEINCEINKNKKLSNIVYLITSDKLGKGSDDLGRILMKSFLYAVSEKKPYPKTMIFLNSGVKLTTQGSESIDDLWKLHEGDVEIVSCGTCLDFFEIKSKLEVGIISNMYTIVDLISSSTNTITI